MLKLYSIDPRERNKIVLCKQSGIVQLTTAYSASSASTFKGLVLETQYATRILAIDIMVTTAIVGASVAPIIDVGAKLDASGVAHASLDVNYFVDAFTIPDNTVIGTVLHVVPGVDIANGLLGLNTVDIPANTELVISCQTAADEGSNDAGACRMRVWYQIADQRVMHGAGEAEFF